MGESVKFVPPQIVMAPPDWFKAQTFAKLAPPNDPLTGEKLWPAGKRFHGGQLDFIKSNAKFKQVTGGVRGGKSDVVASDVLVDILWGWHENRFDWLYWGIGPSYELCEEEMNHLHRMLGELEIEHSFSTPKKESWAIEFPGIATKVQTRTGTEAARIAARAVRKVILVEAHQLSRDIWRNAQERVLQTGGGVTASGTFEDAGEDSDWFREKSVEWGDAMEAEEVENQQRQGDTFPLPTWDNVIFFPGGRTDPKILEIEKNMTPSEFMERLGGKPAKSTKLVIPQAHRAFQVRHRYPFMKTSFDPEFPVYMFSDPGWVHAYAVLAVQIVGKTVWVIDIIYRFERLATEIIAECASRPWAKNVRVHVMDFAARQKRAEGPALTEQWALEWYRLVRPQIPPQIVTQPVALHAGYEIHRKALLNTWPEEEAQAEFNHDGQTRTMIANPEGVQLYFDPSCADALFGGVVDGRKWAGEYRMHRNKKTPSGTALSDEPYDVNNDAIKALNYGLTWRFGAAENKQDVLEMILSGKHQPWKMVS